MSTRGYAVLRSTRSAQRKVHWSFFAGSLTACSRGSNFLAGKREANFQFKNSGQNIDTWSVLYHFDTFRNPKNRFGHPEPFRQTAASLGIPGELVNRYTEKCDVWSFGVIVYIMFCGVPPFTGIHQGRVGDEEIFRKVERVSFFFVKARSFFSNNIYWTV